MRLKKDSGISALMDFILGSFFEDVKREADESQRRFSISATFDSVLMDCARTNGIM